jgi:hypothetical protein
MMAAANKGFLARSALKSEDTKEVEDKKARTGRARATRDEKKKLASLST